MFSQSLEHNRCYQDASPSIPFYFQRVAVIPSDICRVGLHSPSARVSGP